MKPFINSNSFCPSGGAGIIELQNLKVFQVFESHSVPLAKRVEKPYLFGYQGSEKDNEIAGSGNHYTTFHRPYDSRRAQWWKGDPLMYKFPWQSPYIGMDNNPIWNTDKLGDSTLYFNSKGELLHQSNDGLENAVVSVGEKQLGHFNNSLELTKGLSDFDMNSDKFNEGLRSFGVGYAIDDFKSFYNDNKNDQADGWEDGYINEHKTFLYMIGGLIRPGSENYRGDPKNVVGGNPLHSGAKGKLHTHPNAGKPKGFGTQYTHKPSLKDYSSNGSYKHFDVVISDKYIYFINNRQSRNVVIPFKNTFGSENSVKSKSNPWAE